MVNLRTKTYKRDGAGVTAPALSDGSAAYTPGLSQRVSSTSTFFHGGIKNTDTQTNSSKSITATRVYDAFGNVASSTGTWSSPFGYAGPFGYQEDSDSGLKLLGHRYYDSSTGRFLSRDPAKFGRNLYLCSNCNPAGTVDPSGLISIIIHIGRDGLGTGQMYADPGDEIPDGNGGWITAQGGEPVGGEFEVGNNTTNPTGDPFEEGSNGPFPPGTYGIIGAHRPSKEHPREAYGPYWIELSGGIVPSRDTWIHGGRKDHSSPTNGCIRCDNSTIEFIGTVINHNSGRNNTVTVTDDRWIGGFHLGGISWPGIFMPPKKMGGSW